jgi:hypothetical protein
MKLVVAMGVTEQKEWENWRAVNVEGSKRLDN